MRPRERRDARKTERVVGKAAGGAFRGIAADVGGWGARYARRSGDRRGQYSRVLNLEVELCHSH